MNENEMMNGELMEVEETASSGSNLAGKLGKAAIIGAIAIVGYKVFKKFKAKRAAKRAEEDLGEVIDAEIVEEDVENLKKKMNN